MKITPAEIARFLTMLERHPDRIAEAIAGVDSSRLHFKADKRSWSANDILAHIRSCADVWGGTIESMLMEDEPTLPDIHPRQWVKQTDYPGLEFHRSFKAFTSQRAKLVRTLKSIPFEDWLRGSTILGRRHTVYSQTRRMALHENEHCEQIESLLK